MFKNKKDLNAFLRTSSYFPNNPERFSDIIKNYLLDAHAFSEILPHLKFNFIKTVGKADGDRISEYVDAFNNTEILNVLNLNKMV